MSRHQVLTLISMASVNFCSMICYSILGPFFPNEAEKKGVSQTVIGLIFGCYALCNLVASLILGKYIVQIGPKFMLTSGLFVSSVCTILFGLLDRCHRTTPFIIMCFLIRSIDAIGFSAAMTSSFAVIAKVFPSNIATVMGSLEVFTGLGLIMGPPMGGLLYQSFGYEVPFMALGCFVLLMVPFNMCILPHLEATPANDSFVRLFIHPKVLLLCFVIFTLSSGLVRCFVAVLFLKVLISVGFCLLGPTPILHIPRQLWLFVFMLTIIGFSLGLTGIPIFPEIINCAYENGFEEGLSTLGLVSGLFGAVWSTGTFFGPTFGGFVTQRLSFEWASSIEGGIGFVAVSKNHLTVPRVHC
uniref:Solute carrier family 18 member B1 n=1 Tax=Scleropages formosus TaxID=113540 RepID=A0A8C9W4V4_SCLFO